MYNSTFKSHVGVSLINVIGSICICMVPVHPCNQCLQVCALGRIILNEAMGVYTVQTGKNAINTHYKEVIK